MATVGVKGLMSVSLPVTTSSLFSRTVVDVFICVLSTSLFAHIHTRTYWSSTGVSQSLVSLSVGCMESCRFGQKRSIVLYWLQCWVCTTVSSIVIASCPLVLITGVGAELCRCRSRDVLVSMLLCSVLGLLSETSETV